MIEPTEDQKRMPCEPLQGTPDGSACGPISPGDATSNKHTIEERRMMLTEIGVYFTSIGWLVHHDGRGMSIEQVREQTFLQNLSCQDQ